MGEKNTSRLLIFNYLLCSGRMAQRYEASIFALEEDLGAGLNPGRGYYQVFNFRCFFSLIVFLPFCLFLFIFTGDPF